MLIFIVTCAAFCFTSNYVACQTTNAPTNGYCPGGSVSYPQPIVTTTPSPILQRANKRQPKRPLGGRPVLGLDNSILTAASFDPTAILTSPLQQPPSAAESAVAAKPTAGTAAGDLTIFRPPPPQCNYTCYSDSDCTTSGEKCCVQGCQQVCRAAVQLPGPPVTCAAVRCRKGTQCLNLESGAVCSSPVHNGTCPDSTNFYGGNFAGCASDGDCQSNEKCCQSQSAGFVCTPITRPLPLTCDDVYCAGNQACTNNTPNGVPRCVRNKRGQCPYYEALFGPLRSDNGQCLKQCSVDVECSGNLKCCQIGCDMVCIPPDLSYTCQCKQCSGPFVCKEDEYGYGQCVSVTKRPGTCPYVSFPIDFIHCIGNDKPGDCGVDGDCPRNQKCCRPNYCHPSSCLAPETDCSKIYCNYDEMCSNSTGIAVCVKGLCPPPPNPPPFCPVSSALRVSHTCRSNSDCTASAVCSSQICCPGVCGGKTCRKSGIYCGSKSDGTIRVCPAGNLCLNPFYPAVPDYTCYDPNPNQQQIAGCF